MKLATRVNLAGMDTANLTFYSYDSTLNTYRYVQMPDYWIDQNGYLRFTTSYAGDIIISEGPLARR